jgi:hypothetical protein
VAASSVAVIATAHRIVPIRFILHLARNPGLSLLPEPASLYDGTEDCQASLADIF